MIKEEKAGSSSMDLLGENAVQCTLSFIKAIYIEGPRNTMLLLTAIALYWFVLVLSYTFPAQVFRSTIAAATSCEGVTQQHFASDTSGISHFLPRAFSACFLGK